MGEGEERDRGLLEGRNKVREPGKLPRGVVDLDLEE